MLMKFLAHTNGEREQAASSSVDTDIPARLDRLPWSGFHSDCCRRKHVFEFTFAAGASNLLPSYALSR
jgi:hypothetical protein